MNSKFNACDFEFMVNRGAISADNFPPFIEKLNALLETWRMAHLLEGNTTPSAKKHMKKRQDDLGNVKTAIQSMSPSTRQALLLYGKITSDDLDRISAACDKAAKPFGNRPRGMTPDRDGESLCADLTSLYSEYAITPATGYEDGTFIRFVCQGFKVVDQERSPATIRKKIARMNQKFRGNK